MNTDSSKSRKTVVYTAIFGGSDDLVTPDHVTRDAEYVCFTDSADIEAGPWDVRHVIPTSPEESVLNAKAFKLLPHLYFPDYEYSVWVDANVIVRQDVQEYLAEFLADANMATFNHALKVPGARDCIYDEAAALLVAIDMGKRNSLDKRAIERQVERYRLEGYPEHAGLISGSMLLRRHNERDCVDAMNHWWSEILRGSRRDELSFNYVAWKRGFQFEFLPGNCRDCDLCRRVPHKARLPAC